MLIQGQFEKFKAFFLLFHFKMCFVLKKRTDTFKKKKEKKMKKLRTFQMILVKKLLSTPQHYYFTRQ